MSSRPPKGKPTGRIRRRSADDVWTMWRFPPPTSRLQPKQPEDLPSWLRPISKVTMGYLTGGRVQQTGRFNAVPDTSLPAPRNMPVRFSRT